MLYTLLLVQLGIVHTMFENFATLDSPRRLFQFWPNFQTSLVLLIPNCTRYRMITYTENAPDRAKSIYIATAVTTKCVHIRTVYTQKISYIRLTSYPFSSLRYFDIKKIFNSEWKTLLVGHHRHVIQAVEIRHGLHSNNHTLYGKH